MSNESEELFCLRCNKKLENVRCIACEGKGEFKEGKRIVECLICNGSGYILRCPDELKHIREDFKLGKPPRIKPLYNHFRSGKPYNINPSTPINRQSPTKGVEILPPWNSAYPYTWHPNHPRNPINPANPNSPFARNRQNINFQNNPFNWNRRLPGEPSTDAPPPPFPFDDKDKG